MKSYTDFINERARADGGTDYVNKYVNIKDWSVETPSLKATDDASAAVQKTPHRVPLSAVTDKIIDVEYLHPTAMPHLTIAVCYTVNGFALIGKTAPADPANYDEELGKRFSFEDAARQLWQLEGYLLREKLYQESQS